MVLLIGIFILAYMIAAKPAGTLTVIYERRLPSAPAAPASPPPPEVIEALAAVPGGPGRPLEGPAGIEARLATLKRLRASGAISEDEYQARRNKILDEV
jgi:hypothetical protein